MSTIRKNYIKKSQIDLRWATIISGCYQMRNFRFICLRWCDASVQFLESVSSHRVEKKLNFNSLSMSTLLYMDFVRLSRFPRSPVRHCEIGWGHVRVAWLKTSKNINHLEKCLSFSLGKNRKKKISAGWSSLWTCLHSNV